MDHPPPSPARQRPRLVVIGGGAAGFFGGIACAEEAGGAVDVRILEKGPEVLAKVRISGGGRCNVTHACFDPRDLAGHYPRGGRSLIGPFHRWQPADTMDWFERRGVPLATEDDGRVFPATDRSETIIDCLTTAAREAGVRWDTRLGVEAVSRSPEGTFAVSTSGGDTIPAGAVLLAAGGTRSRAARRPAEQLGHSLVPATPSLFTFRIDDPLLAGLPGVSVPRARLRDLGTGRTAEGPLLITHHGLSGPAVLRLSAWGAREMGERDYRFDLSVDWTGGLTPEAILDRFAVEKRERGARRVGRQRPLPDLPRRLWTALVEKAGIDPAVGWANLTREASRTLAGLLGDTPLAVRGKSLNKEEFVTCGGVPLREVDPKTFESRRCPGLFLAGEVLDIDGITGGFNFQAAWTTGWLAGRAAASRLGATS